MINIADPGKEKVSKMLLSIVGGIALVAILTVCHLLWNVIEDVFDNSEDDED